MRWFTYATTILEWKFPRTPDVFKMDRAFEGLQVIFPGSMAGLGGVEHATKRSA